MNNASFFSHGQYACEDSRESDQMFPIKNIYLRQVGILWDVEEDHSNRQAFILLEYKQILGRIVNFFFINTFQY